MSMLDHHLQRDIVYNLAFAEGLRFSELKPDDVENKLFTYHLKKILTAGYAQKNEDGTYSLTPEGRRVGVGAFQKQHMGTARAYSILLLAVRRTEDGAWLLNHRNTHPLLGKVGFVHTTPIADQLTTDRAAAHLLQATALMANFSVAGHGYLRMFEGDELESFTHFTLLFANDAEGTLTESSEFADYYWDASPDFTNEEMLPSMQHLVKMIEHPEVTFKDLSFKI